MNSWSGVNELLRTKKICKRQCDYVLTSRYSTNRGTLMIIYNIDI